MAKISFLICFVFALVAVMEVESATHQAPAPSVDCSTLVLTMADCLSFVTNGSTLKKPEGGCCKGLKNVLKTDAECLCETFKSSSQLGIVLDIAKAATLPAACNVKAPSISNCALSVTPSAVPGLSPSMSPANAPGSSDTTGGAITPARAPASSGAVVSPVSFVALVVLFVASCLHF